MPPNRFESEVESFLEGSHGDRTHIKRADHHTVTPLCGTLLKICEKAAFRASWANFVPNMRCPGSCWASFFTELLLDGPCWASIFARTGTVPVLEAARRPPRWWRWGFCAMRSPLAACRRRVGGLDGVIPPGWWPGRVVGREGRRLGWRHSPRLVAA